MASQAFKVIVVGGGPVGLTAAHALTRADIDFIVLERREDAIIDAGSNLVLLPQGLRILSQIGLLDSLHNVSSPMRRILRFDHSGRSIGDMHWFTLMKEHFGAFPRVVSRHDLTKVLFESLPAKSQAKIITNKKAVDIQSHDNGVTVSCQDGTSYSGAMIIGADGAHSTVRGLMRDLAVKDFSPEINEEQPFNTSYRCLWVRFPTAASPDLHPGFTSETHGRGASTQVFVGEGTGVIGVYERMDEPTKERIRYTQADQDALIDRLGHLPLTEDGKFTLRTAFEQRVQSGLVSLEEGVVKHWSWGGQVVLAGDAAHKFTPSTGAGCNNGIIDVVALVNELQKVFQDARASSASGDTSPSRFDVKVAMKRYQEARYAAVTTGCKTAGNATALSTWSNGMFKFIDCHLLGERVQKRLSGSSSSNVARMPVFNFVDAKENIAGKTPWTQPLPCTAMKVM